MLLATTVLLMSFLNTAQAQTEIKVNPMGLLFGNIDMGIEFGLNDYFGIEARPHLDFSKFKVNSEEYRSNEIGTMVEGKYYTKPQAGLDRFYINAFGKFSTGNSKTINNSVTSEKVSHTKFTIGFGLGYKWVSTQNIVVEVGGGLGRAVINEWKNSDPAVDLSDFPILNLGSYAKLAVGYRF